MEGLSDFAAEHLTLRTVSTYTAKAKTVFQDAQHLHVAADETTISGESTVVSVLHDADTGITGYGPIQVHSHG